MASWEESFADEWRGASWHVQKFFHDGDLYLALGVATGREIEAQFLVPWKVFVEAGDVMLPHADPIIDFQDLRECVLGDLTEANMDYSPAVAEETYYSTLRNLKRMGIIPRVPPRP